MSWIPIALDGGQIPGLPSLAWGATSQDSLASVGGQIPGPLAFLGGRIPGFYSKKK